MAARPTDEDIGPEPDRTFRVRARPKAEPSRSSVPEPGDEAVGGESLWPPPRIWLLRLGMAASLVGALLGLWLLLTALVWAVTDLVLPFLGGAYAALARSDASILSKLGGVLAAARDLPRLVICLPASVPLVGALVGFGELRKKARLSRLLARPDLRSGVHVTRLGDQGIACRWPWGKDFTIDWNDVVDVRLIRDAAWEGHGFSIVAYRAMGTRSEQVAVWEGQTVGDTTLGVRLPVHLAFRRSRCGPGLTQDGA